MGALKACQYWQAELGGVSPLGDENSGLIVRGLIASDGGGVRRIESSGAPGRPRPEVALVDRN